MGNSNETTFSDLADVPDARWGVGHGRGHDSERGGGESCWLSNRDVYVRMGRFSF